MPKKSVQGELKIILYNLAEFRECYEHLEDVKKKVTVTAEVNDEYFVPFFISQKLADEIGVKIGKIFGEGEERFGISRLAFEIPSFNICDVFPVHISNYFDGDCIIGAQAIDIMNIQCDDDGKLFLKYRQDMIN